MSLSPEKIRAARALLNWSQERLAQAASIGTATIKRLEKSEEGAAGRATPVVENAVASALAAAGVILDPKPEDLAGDGIVVCIALRKI